MDINSIPFDSDEDGEITSGTYDITQCQYAIFLCPPINIFPYESFAFVVYSENHDGIGGSLRVYNPTKRTHAQGFQKDLSILRRKYSSMKNLVTKSGEATLIWEGKINGEIKGSPFGPTWFN